MTTTRAIQAADLFCGSGGTSTGLMQAAKEMGLKVNLIAVNHWQTAIETHTANHPGVTHFCEDLETVNPRHAVPGGRLDLLVASPECTHHSNARGGRPMNDQSRASAWHILRWAEALYIENILIENVKEFRDWGPLGEDGRPVASMKGRLYRQFLASLRALGYQVSERVVNAADFGDATTRQRLFIQARRGKRPSWPAPSHMKPVGSAGIPGLLEGIPTWRSAREIIDWSLPSRSIYERKRPLAPATMARIFAGLRKYSGLPFIVPNLSEQEGRKPRTRDINSPLPTVKTFGGGNLVEPFILNLRGGRDGYLRATSIEEPLGTVTTISPAGVVEPFLVKFYAGSDAASVDSPVPTITANYEHLGLAQPYLVVLQNNRDGYSLDKPLPTITTSGAHFGMAEPFIIPVTHQGGRERSHDIDNPLPTITCARRGELAICEPFLTEFHGGAASENRTRSVEEPICTLDTSNRVGLAQPFLVTYYGNGEAVSLDEPLDTITARDRFALVDPRLVTEGMVDKGQVVGYLDIRFRMLQPHELSAAMSFPKEYHFAGNREARVKQIGNSVAVGTAKALCMTILGGLSHG